MSFAKDGFVTSTSGRPPVGSTVASKSAHPHATAIPIISAAPISRISACAAVTRGSARIARLLVKVNAREDACREQAAGGVKKLTGKSRRSPRIHRPAKEPVRSRRAQLEDGMIGVARAVAPLHANIEDRFLMEHPDSGVREEWKARDRARREDFERKVLRLEMVVAFSAVADLREVDPFALRPVEEILEAGNGPTHLAPRGDESRRDRHAAWLERARDCDGEQVRFDIEHANWR